MAQSPPRRVLVGLRQTASSNPATTERSAKAESELFERGLQRRRKVLGNEHVDANLRDGDDFMMAIQRAVHRGCLGLGLK
jgi:hypothetical protein